VKLRDETVLALAMLAVFSIGCQPQQAPPAIETPAALELPPEHEASEPDQRRLSEVVEIPRQILTFRPTRDDITVGCVIFTLDHSKSDEMNLDAVRINGAKPEIPTIFLNQVGNNQFELPAMKIEFSSVELGGPLYLAVKVWFNELTNLYDSQFYENVPDRYALLSYCTKEDEDPSKVNVRQGANRAANLKEFNDALARPFVIKLNRQPIMEEWGRYPILPPGDRLSADEFKAVEKAVRDKGEEYLISISVRDSDHATVFVGEKTYFRGARAYTVVRSDGAWRVESVRTVKD
jgi:hypothetical protein